MHFNYEEIIQDIVEDLPERAKTIVIRRFGLDNSAKQTLQVVGKDLGITRERVRQIQRSAFVKMKDRAKRHNDIFDFFSNQLKTSGNLRREDILLKILSPELSKNQIFLLLCLSNDLSRHLETKDFYTLWVIDKNSLELAKKINQQILNQLNKSYKSLEINELELLTKTPSYILFSFLEVSKQICKGPQGFWGLKHWPEINPKGTRDKAYIIFKQTKTPLHFAKVADLINQSRVFDSKKKAHPQTVHNELIKDHRFVLVGRGLYALKEWGYEPGVVKDVIVNILKNTNNLLDKQEIVEKVLKQRFVKKNTITLNLNDKKYFKRTSEGKYILC
ncbi:MAG: hypothetical protein ISS87_00760 [Candidatus Pacebacteria bacterium]|nr:hypothetical protein [Candidatus Paceibacterota bacterium]